MTLTSLRARLLVAILTIIVLVLVVVTGVSMRVTRTEFDRFLHRERIGSIDQLAGQVEASYRQEGSWRAVSPLLQLLSSNAHRPLVVLDPSGRIAAAAPAGMEKAAVRQTAGRIDFDLLDDGRRLQLINPPRAILRANGRVTGTLLVLPTFPSEEVVKHGYVMSVNRGILAAVAGAGLLAVLLVIGMLRRLTGPLEELTALTRDMARGNLQRRARVSGRDEIAHLAESFNSMADALAANESARRAMVSDVAHELRTPLTNVRCTLESIEDGLLPLDRAVVGTLQGEIELLTRLVDDLQELALADAGQLRIVRQEINVREFLDNVARTVAPQSLSHSQRVEVEADRSLVVQADPQRLQQMIRNLLENAIRFTPRGGLIALRGVSAGNATTLSVADSGAGIAAEHLPRLFERFYRVDPSRSRHTGGSGLGLAIVRALARAHGGDVEVESAEGNGATFTIRIPRHAEERSDSSS